MALKGVPPDEGHRGNRLRRRLLRDLSGVPENLQGLQAGIPGRLPGAEPGHITCGDCEEYESCESIQSFLNHHSYKYGKYKQALEYIRAHDYAAFMKAAENWKNAYGKYPEQDN